MKAPRPARRAPLSRERIVAAATGLIEREGAESLSARRLAAVLGCEAMSLYHHVANMRELLDDVVDGVLGSLPLPPAAAPDPRKRLADMTRAYLELARSRPHAFRVISTRRWRTAAEMTYQARMIELLMSAGLTTAAWELDPGRVSLQSAPSSMQQLARFSNAAELARDLDFGLELLLRNLLPGG